MAFDFKSDILVDAMRAADPSKVAESKQKLIDMVQTNVRAQPTSEPFQVQSRGALRTPQSAGHEAEVLKKFEAAVLSTFVQSMMPKEATSVFGEGLSGDMWKSQMAEKIADQIAQRGGVGIASRLLKDFQMNGDNAVPLQGARPVDKAVPDSVGDDFSVRQINLLQMETLSANKADQRHGTLTQDNGGENS